MLNQNNRNIKTMSTKEVAEALNTSDRTINRHLKEIRGSDKYNLDTNVQVGQGIENKITEQEVIEIKNRMRNNNELPVTDLEMEQMTLKVFEYHAMKIKRLEQKIEQDKPLVEFANTVANSSNAISIREYAKLLADENIKIGQNRLFEWFRFNRYFMNNNEPYQKYVEQDYFKVIEQTYSTPYGDKTRPKTLITGKGQIYFTEKLRKEVNNK